MKLNNNINNSNKLRHGYNLRNRNNKNNTQKLYNKSIVKDNQVDNKIRFGLKIGNDTKITFPKKIVNQNRWSPVLGVQIKNKYRTLKGLDRFVSATKLKNYLIKDPCMDWYKCISKDFTKKQSVVRKEIDKSVINTLNKPKNTESSLKFLFECGNIFEKKVLDDIKKRFPKLVETTNLHDDMVLNHLHTVDRMKRGVPFIEQAGLCDPEIGIFGYADLIVRSDYLNILTDYSYVEDYVKCPAINNNIHYVVIDIKWSTIHLCADGTRLRNDKLMPAYKGQLAIYNVIVGKIQGYIPLQSYIMGKGFKYEKNKLVFEGCCYNNRLGVIDYSGFDNCFIELTKNAIEWVREVRSEWDKWSFINPCRPELYPNMCSQSDGIYSEMKKAHAYLNKELTLLWYVGVKNRNAAHKNGVFKYDDPKLSAELMDIKGDRAKIINNMITLMNDPVSVIYPEKIKNNNNNWQVKYELDFYVDFETLNTVFIDKSDMDIYDCKKDNVQDYIFMIGVGYEDNGVFKYECFKTEDTRPESEFEIMKKFINFIEKKTDTYSIQNSIPKNKCIRRLFHWAPAETIIFEHFNKRYEDVFIDWDVEWTDFCDVFKKEPILIKGAMSFGLKEIAKTMKKNGMINTTWDDEITNGFGAALSACDYYHKKKSGLTKKLDEIMENIIKYNRVDCCVLWEIVEFCRKHNDIEMS